jgi:GTP cyclohydrolase I
MDHSMIERGVRLILKGLGCSTNDRNFAETPERFARAMDEIFNPRQTEYAAFPESFTDFILLRNHQLWSLCPHHLFPVQLHVSIAYIPNGDVIGLSKLGRILHECNDGPILQERFTRIVLDRLEEVTGGTHGTACLVVANHGCMQMRGLKTSGDVVTYKLTGDFLNKPHIQDRFFQLTTGGRK